MLIITVYSQGTFRFELIFVANSGCRMSSFKIYIYMYFVPYFN